jgi:hypothetical protein
MWDFQDPLASLAKPPVGRSRRISSNEQPNWSDGNFDMTRLAPGETFELPVLEGPGVITHIWMTSHAGGMNELNALSLRIYWDGRDEPGVEVPLGEFFAVGQGKPAVVESVPVQVSPTGSLTCYWRMPFARSARIVITNDNRDRSSGLYWQVDWTQLDALPADTSYFHARYRQEYPALMGRDYVVADIEGSGKYVGTVLSVTLGQDGWFGEGDDFFFVDGEEVPSLQGTGTEDYFNDAWGFRPRTGNWFGQPRWQGWEAGDSGVCYRWHVLDPVHFTRSLKFSLEHKGNWPESEDAWYIERPDFFSSVAFWYQTGLPKPSGELPPWPDRCVPWTKIHLVPQLPGLREMYGGQVKVEATGFFGGRPALTWTPTEGSGRLQIPFSIGAHGRYAVRLTVLTGPGSGVFDFAVDDRTVPCADLCSAEASELDLLLGTFELSAGSHNVTITALPSDRGTIASLSVEMLRLLKLPPQAERTVKTHNEAHFVRLAIGRATYAYRLAFGLLPGSLNELVEAEMLPSRFLSDENGHPLASRREGEYLVVESSAPGGWSHRWQGLDARR